MKIHYELTGKGWADGYITLDNQKAGFCVSYMQDALGHLTESIISLINNFGQEMEVHNLDKSVTIEKNNKEKITWEGEPWGHKWNLELNDDLTIHVSFRTFENLDNEATLKREESLQGTMPFEEFVKAIVDMLETLLKTNGFVGYKNSWHSHEFPIGNYLLLKDFLDTDGITTITSQTDAISEDGIEMLVGFEPKTNLTKEIEKLKILCINN